MKLNIIGSGRGWQNAPRDVQSWGFTAVLELRPVDVLFDMHPLPDELSGKRQEQGKTRKNPQLFEKMLRKAKARNVPIYSLENYEGCIRYPIEDIVEYFDKDYFTCGIDYATALAIYKGATEIHYYGIVLVKYEYQFEK